MEKAFKLYHYPLSHFCRKLRLVLAEKKIEIELIEERYWERRKKFMWLNPAGQVPVLRCPDQILCDSQAICEYLEAIHPDPPLLPEDPKQQYETRRMINWFDDKFCKEVTSGLLRERLLKRIQKRGSPDGHRIRLALKYLAFHTQFINYLLERKKWIAGNRMTLADFAAAAHISCLDYISDVDWDGNAAMKDWYATIKSRPAFRPILADQIPEHRPPHHYADLDF